MLPVSGHQLVRGEEAGSPCKRLLHGLPASSPRTRGWQHHNIDDVSNIDNIDDDADYVNDANNYEDGVKLTVMYSASSG